MNKINSYVLFFDYQKPINSLKACVKKCPSELIDTKEKFKSFTLQNNYTFCLYNVSIGDYDEKLCPSLPIYPTINTLNRCVPNINEKLKNYSTVIKKFINYDLYEIGTVELYHDLPKIGYMAICSLVITIILVFLLRFISKVLVIIIYLISILGMTGNQIIDNIHKI